MERIEMLFKEGVLKLLRVRLSNSKVQFEFGYRYLTFKLQNILK